MEILDGKKVRDAIAEKLKRELKKLGARPKLVIMEVGEDERSAVYVRQKKIFGERLGFEVEYVNPRASVSEKDLIAEIGNFNRDAGVHGIIVQLPLPKKFDALAVIEAISPEKDVDGLHSENLRLLLEGRKGGFLPATTKGILTLLDFYKIPIAGKKTVIIGRSLLVGRPTALAFLNRDATVTICHTKTKNLADETRRADILVSAVGMPKFLKKSFVRRG